MGSARTPEPMKSEGNMATNWKRFKIDFEIYRAATKLYTEDDKTQIGKLFNLMGSQQNELFERFTAKPVSYDEMMKQLGTHFLSKNKNEHRRRFNQRIQKENESVRSFVEDLKNIASHCDFMTSTEERIIERILAGVRSREMSDRLCRESDLSIGKAIEICERDEKSPIKSTKIPRKSGDADVAGPSKKTVKSAANKTNSTPRKCTNCNGEGHTKAKCPSPPKEKKSKPKIVTKMERD